MGQNRPVIIRGGVNHWPALTKWQTNEYLLQKVNLGNQVTVAVTPTGYADAIVDHDKFVMPLEESMPFSKFIQIMENPEAYEGIHYVQKQNSNLTEEMNELIEDVEELNWARESFGKSPDAINFWMGDERAVTSSKEAH